MGLGGVAIAVSPYVIHPKTAVLGRAGGGVLLILTQKNSQKFGDVLGIMSRGAEKKVAKIVQTERNEACFNCRGAAYFIKRNRLALICDACKEQRTALNQKDCPVFYKTLYYGVNKSRYSIFLLRSMEGTIFPFHLLKST